MGQRKKSFFLHKFTAYVWINGGSPSEAFLSGAIGPFTGIYQAIAGAGWMST